MKEPLLHDRFVIFLEDPDGIGDSPWSVQAPTLAEAVAKARADWRTWCEAEPDELPAVVKAYPGWIGDRISFSPALNIPEPVGMSVLDIRPGDRVDLEGAPNWTDPGAEFELATCTGAERETVECVRLDFEGLPSLGIDASESLPVVRREFFPDAADWD